jgi:signal transduction histidine kinase
VTPPSVLTASRRGALNMGDGGATPAMEPRARLQLLVAIVLFGAAAVLVVLQGSVLQMGVIVAEGAKLAIGVLIFVRKPGNIIGSLLVVIGVGFVVLFAADLVAVSFADSGRGDVASWIAYLFGPLAVLVIVLQSAMLLLFPHGRFSSRWDRRFMWLVGLYGVALVAFSVFTSPGSVTDPTAEGYPHPFITASWAEELGDAVPALFAVLLVSFLVAAVRLVMRARRSGSVERHQIRWVGLGCAIYWVTGMSNAALDPLGSFEGGFQFADSVMASVIPVTIGVAIFRHRLYDIDVIVSKSVTYLGLAASISLLYTAVVVGPILVIGGNAEGGPGLLLPILATAVVAVAFEPIRARMQRWADRLVYGTRATPHEVLSQVTASLSETSVGGGTSGLARLLAGGTGAERAVVWVRDGDRFRPEGVFPAELSAGLEPVPADHLVGDELTEWRPVHHRNELFGALSVTKPVNDPITPADRELLTDVAAGAGLLLRNIGLNRELELRAEEVRASRRRLMAAQDAERHRLERDLHDGAQQQVVALKVKLGIAKTIAQREGADEIVTRVVALAEEAQQTVDALRAVAHGIYPPLLASEGLESALRAVGRTSSVPLVVDASALTRYDRPVEETVYFSVLETVERARMSGASEMRVALTASSSALELDIDLERVGDIDLTAVTDRIDAIGGSMMIEPRSGRGFRVVCSLPLREVVGTT